MKYFTLYILLLISVVLQAQDRTVENRPYCDLRPFHFGVVVGANLQDLNFTNVGPQTYTNEDGTEEESLVTCEQSKWEPGFQVGVLGEMRLSDYFAFRIAPILYFANRHLVFTNLKEYDAKGNYVQEKQDMKTVYITCSADLIYAAKRFNNHRPYLMAGVAPALNLTTKSSDCMQLNRGDIFFEIGMGCDFYLPYFKLRPELKFMCSLTNSLNKNHINNIKDSNLKKYAYGVSSARSSIIALTFYFE